MLPPFRKIKTEIKDLRVVQDALALIFNRLLGVSFLDGRTVTAVLASGDNRIEHGLGREPEGYFILRKNAAATIYDKLASSQLTERFLVLNSSATVTVTLWVF